MAILTKAQLQADNSASFADNNTQAITPLILRSYNGNIIDTLVDSLDTGSFANTAVSNTFTAANQFTSISASSFVSASAFVGDGSKLTGVTASVSLPISEEGVLLGNTTQLNFSGSSITAVLNAGIATISVNTNNLVTTSSFNSFTQSVETTSASVSTSITNLNASSASQQVSINALNVFTSSQSTASIDTSITNLNTFSASTLTRLTNIESTTASLNTSITNLNSFSSSQLTKDTTLQTYTASVNQTTASLNQFSASALTSINNLNQSTASLFTSASLGLVTASVNTNVITFSKGDGTTFNLTVAASGSITPGTISGSAQITALGFVSSSVTASSLVTASFDNGTRNLTFTKGDASTFNVNIPDISGSQGDFVTTASFNSYTQSNDQRVTSLETNSASVNISISNINLTTASLNTSVNQLNLNTASQQVSIDNLNLNSASVNTSITNINQFTASQSTASIVNSITELNSFSASALISISNLNQATSSLFTSTSLSLTTASFANTNITFTKGDASQFSLNGFATTGSNTFRGNETFEDAAGNASTLVPTSGSLMLVAKSFTSASAHLSASTATQVNLIFKNNNNTGDTIISGSNNILVNATNLTIGFKKYVGGSGNIILNTSGFPQISGSMGFNPNMNNNYISSNEFIMRGPVSSSTYTISNNVLLGGIFIGQSDILHARGLTSGLSMQSNTIQGTVSITANQTALTGSTTAFSNNSVNGVVTLNLSSSAASLNNNIINDNGFSLTNQFFSSSAGLGTVAMNRNSIGGQNNQIIITGGQPSGSTTANSISDNVIFGGSNTIFIDVANSRVSGSTSYQNAIRNGLIGNNLIVSGSSLLADLSSLGSVFVGRYNANDAIRNKTSDIVFAVGTGNTTTRKTGFHIDTGSNAFVEGTFNVSGSTSFTGSVAGNVVSASITSNTASINFSLGNYFVVTSSITPLHLNVTNITPGTTSTLIISASASSSILFSPNVAQPSGSQYSGSQGSIDIISLVAFTNTKVNLVSTKALV